MKKLLLLLAAPLAAIGIAAATPASAAAPTPSCTSNIVDGSAGYFPSTSTLSGTISTGVDVLDNLPACRNVQYGAIISYISDGSHVVGVTAQNGNGADFFLRWSFSPVTSDDQNTFCVMLFSRKGSTLLDTAPSTANLTAFPTPVVDLSSSNGYSCGSGWVAVNPTGSSGGGGSQFTG